MRCPSRTVEVGPRACEHSGHAPMGARIELTTIRGRPVRSRFLENIGDLHWKILALMRGLSGERHTQLTETKEVIKKNESTIKYMAWGQGRARREDLTGAAAYTRMGTSVGSLAIPRVNRKGLFPLACKKRKTEAPASRSWSGRR